MIKLSDYIAKRLKEHYKVNNFFMVSGGGAMHLNDSLGRAIPYICNHNEQGCAIAAEGYARVGQKLAVVNVTTGPGGLNALNGVFGQWTDSVPVLYISGQVKYNTCKAVCPELRLRQLGDQEADIISVVRPLTKYAVTVTEPRDIKYHLDKAVYLATHGRFGPVWLDIPMNVQAAVIDERALREFTEPVEPGSDLSAVPEILRRIEKAERPLIVAGNGIHLAGQEENFYKLIDIVNIPVVTTFNAIDILPSDHKNFCGRIGTVGQRAGNFNLQNADLVLFLGTRNNIRQVSYNWENFAKKAFKIVVDIDINELRKPLVKPDMPVRADLKDLIPAMLRSAEHTEKSSWLEFCKKLLEKYSFGKVPEYRQDGPEINVYRFIYYLTKVLPEKALLVAANGSACVCLHQAGIIKSGQRIFYNSGDASMGYDLPAALGAAVYARRDVVCLAGDGSIMMNLQELETISYNKLPVKIFIINNAGYSSIRQTQKNFFEGRMTGSGADSGVGLPDFHALAAAFGLPYYAIKEAEDLEEHIGSVLDKKAPFICEVFTGREYAFLPKLSARKLPDGSMVSPSLEDMYPFLDRKEFEEDSVI